LVAAVLRHAVRRGSGAPALSRLGHYRRLVRAIYRRCLRSRYLRSHSDRDNLPR